MNSIYCNVFNVGKLKIRKERERNLVSHPCEGHHRYTYGDTNRMQLCTVSEHAIAHSRMHKHGNNMPTANY